MKKIKGFTLAEVLITLTILGVVAAITVPSLQKQNYKRTQISRMAKAYSSLEKAATNIAQNSNCIGKDLECTGLLDITTLSTLQDKFVELSNFRVSKKYSGNYFKPKPLSYEKDKTAKWNRMPYPIFVTTPDNIAYSVDISDLLVYFDQNGNYKYKKALIVTVFTDKSLMYNTEGKFINWQTGMGVNDAIIGRSAFFFIIYDNFQVAPIIHTNGGNYIPLASRKCTRPGGRACDPNNMGGCQRANETCISDGNSEGINCAAKIVCDGWKMKY